MANVKINNQLTEYKVPAASTSFVKTVSSTATTLASLGVVFPAGLQHLRLQVQTQPVRVTYDMTTPSATVGESLPALTTLTISSDVAGAIQLIREGASDATIFGQFFGF